MTSPVTVTRWGSAAETGAAATALRAIAPAARPAAANPINRIILILALLSSSGGFRRDGHAQPLVVILAVAAPISSMPTGSATMRGT